MKKIIFCLCLFACLFLLGGCETIRQIDKNTTFIPHNWSTIAILPFSGEQAFARASAELFSFNMFKQKQFEIIQPAIAEITLQKKGLNIYEGTESIPEAREAGHLLKADAVIVGNIKINYGFELHAIANLKLIDTKSDHIIASIVLSDSLIFSRNEHDHVVAAIEEASKEMLLVLEGLSSKPAIPGRQGRTDSKS